MRSRRALVGVHALALGVFDRSGELAFGIERSASDDLYAAIALLFGGQNPANFERRARVGNADVGLERCRAQFLGGGDELLGGRGRRRSETCRGGGDDLILVRKIATQAQHHVFIALQRGVGGGYGSRRDCSARRNRPQINAVAGHWSVDEGDSADSGFRFECCRRCWAGRGRGCAGSGHRRRGTL